MKAAPENGRVDSLAVEDLQLYIPFLLRGPVNRAEVLGTITHLWFHSPLHVKWPMQFLRANVLPAIEQRQFLIVRHRAGRPLLYVSWANLDLARERQYLLDPHSLRTSDWNSGDRMWFVDWIAPFGGSRRIASLLRQKIFKDGTACSLRVKPEGEVGRIHHHFGCGIASEKRRSVAEAMGQMLSQFPGAKIHPAP